MNKSNTSGAQSARKPRNAKGTILRLFQTMLHERALFVLALGLTLAGNLLRPSTPSARRAASPGT